MCDLRSAFENSFTRDCADAAKASVCFADGKYVKWITQNRRMWFPFKPALTVIGVKGRKRYVLNVINKHLDAAATEAEIRRQRELCSPCAVIVEDKANGSAVVERFRLNVPGVIAVNPQGGKVARMFAAAPEWQAGDWHLDRNAAWVGPFVEQITMFPAAAHDDMVDAMTQAAAWLLKASQRYGAIYYAFSGREIPGCYR